MEMNNIPEMFQSKLRLMIVSGLIRQPLSFTALKQLTGATDGNLSVQISNLEEAGYIKVSRSGSGRGSHTVCRITSKGSRALRAYQKALMGYFST